MAALMKDEYLVGLWKRHQPYHLLWFLEHPSTRLNSNDNQDNSYIAPSWSWASTFGRVTDHPINRIEGEKILVEILEGQYGNCYPD